MTKKTEGKATLNIYTKLQLIQSEVKELIRTEENKFQKYKFFNELQVLKLLRPLLNKYQLTILLSDDTSQPFIHEKDGKEHYVKYLKRLEIVDCEAIGSSLPRKGQQTIDSENPDNKLLFNFWAAGSNVDLAKAKGSSETYAIKYMLSKFFLMPVKDEADPDYGKKEEEEITKKEVPSSIPDVDKSLTELQDQTNTISIKQVDDLIKLFRQKTSDSKERQTNFCTELDRLLAKRGIEDNTNAGNFRARLATLTPADYQHLYNWLLKLGDK